VIRSFQGRQRAAIQRRGIGRKTMKQALFIVPGLVAVLGFAPAVAAPDCSRPPTSIAAMCNKKAGGYCRQGIWYVSTHQIAAKNQCVFEMSRAKRPK
jgi:hypothetical protein